MAIPSEYEWFKKVNNISIGNQNFYDFTTVVNQDWGQSYSISPYDYTWTGIVYQGTDYKLDYAHENANAVWLSCYSPIIRIDITTIGVDYPRVTYSNANLTRPFADGQYTYKFTTQNNNMTYQNYPSYQLFPPASFETLDDALEYLYSWFTNITLYVDGELWVQAGPIQHTWQSVPSISGKNGILSLTQIKAESINDGEPVSGASDSAFTGMSDDNNVATLVDVGELNNNKAKVVYNIPALTSGNYSYAKLVYKQGFIPTSKDDGTAVDLDLTDLGTNKTITVSNIVSGSVYWFVIFTDKSESDAVSLGENTEGVFFELDLTTDGRDVIRYNPAKEFLGAKQGELVGNNFTISDGVLDTSYDISWYYDSAENPKSIPADCTLTFEYDTFFPNGEGYLDWYIIDSDDTQRIYWCFDTKHAFQANKWYNCKVVAKVENGKITRYKYVLDGAEVACGTGDNILMPCTNTDTSKGISRIYFDITRQTKFKNMSIYYDFSEYHDGGGSGSGSSSGT